MSSNQPSQPRTPVGDAPDGAAPLCPSAQADMAGGVVFGVNVSTTEVPQIGYLKEPIPVSESIIMLTAPLRPGAVFRIAAPCAQHRCSHFDGARCSLAARTVQMLPEAVDAPPPCRIRPNCQWWRQEGRAACLRCPQVITEPSDPSAQVRMAADPSTPIEVLGHPRQEVHD